MEAHVLDMRMSATPPDIEDGPAPDAIGANDEHAERRKANP